MTDSRRHRSSRTTGTPSIAHVDEHNPIWSFPGFHIEQTQSWGLISADVVSRAAGEVVWRSNRHRIVYALTDIRGSMQSDDRPAREVPLLQNNFSLIPSGVTIRSNTSEPIRFIQILQSPVVYDDFISDMVRGGTVPLEPRTAFSDPLVSQIALTIANEIEGGFLDHILADALNTALAVKITRRFVDRSTIMLEPSNGLSRARLKIDVRWLWSVKPDLPPEKWTPGYADFASARSGVM